MKNIQLSVVIVSYNNEKQLPRCLDSIVAEIQNLPAQLIVIDNASTDNTAKVAKKLITDHQSLITVQFIQNKLNFGYSKAVNQGFKLADGECILLLNADTILIKGSLKTLLEFEKTHRPCVIGPQLLNADGTIQSSVFHLPTVVGAMKEFWFGKVGDYSKYTPPGNEPVKVEAVLGGAILISKDIIIKIGGFDEKYFMYFEDLDFCRRIDQAGFPIYYLPTANIIHEHGASGKSLADSANQWRRMIPSSKIYFGPLNHYLMTAILWAAHKVKR